MVDDIVGYVIDKEVMVITLDLEMTDYLRQLRDYSFDRLRDASSASPPSDIMTYGTLTGIVDYIDTVNPADARVIGNIDTTGDMVTCEINTYILRFLRPLEDDTSDLLKDITNEVLGYTDIEREDDKVTLIEFFTGVVNAFKVAFIGMLLKNCDVYLDIKSGIDYTAGRIVNITTPILQQYTHEAKGGCGYNRASLVELEEFITVESLDKLHDSIQMLPKGFSRGVVGQVFVYTDKWPESVMVRFNMLYSNAIDF